MMEYSIRISGETVYYPQHEDLHEAWTSLVTAFEVFGETAEVIQMKEAYIAARHKMEGPVLWEDRPANYNEGAWSA